MEILEILRGHVTFRTQMFFPDYGVQVNFYCSTD